MSARDRMQQEAENIKQRKEQRAQMRKEPFRFFLKTDEEREVLVVDACSADDLFLRREHVLKDNEGKYRWTVPCNDDTGNCPVCENHPDRPSSLNLLLTVIDLTPYVNNDGEEIPWSKKLMVVKPGQHKKFTRWAEREVEGEIGLRGLILRCYRSGQKAYAIGDDIEVVERISEDDLLTYETEYEDSEGKKVEILGHEAFDYEDIFPQMSEAELAELIGVQPKERLGSRRSADRDIERGGSSGRAAPGRAAPGRAAPARGRAAPAEQDDDTDDQPSGRRAAPARGASTRSAAPARGAATTRAARRPADSDSDDDQDQAQNDAPAPTTRRGAAAGGGSTRAATRRGAAPAPDERNDIGGEAPWTDGDDDGTNQVEGADGQDDAAPPPAARRGVRRVATARRGA